MFVLVGTIVVQTGHMFEHVVQMVQMHLWDQPPAFAHGMIGQLDLEWVHFLMTLAIALVAVFLLTRWPTNPACWLLMPLALWHLAEHSVILTAYLRTGITGTSGILAKGGLLNGPLARPDLHFLYNAGVLVLLIGIWIWQQRAPGAVGRPARSALALASGVTASLALALGTLVVSVAPVRWVEGSSLQKAIDMAPARSVLHLRPGLYVGPITISKPLTMVGPATIVGGPDQPTVTIAANGVSLSQVSVSGGDVGILVMRSIRVNLEDIRVSGAVRRGIDIVLSSAQVHSCEVIDPASSFAWGIDVVNSMGSHRPPSTIQGCRVSGGQEGIVSHASMVFIRDNQVSKTSLRGIAVTEMSEGDVDHNRIEDVMGAGLYCGDRSFCNLRQNTVVGARAQPDVPADWSAGFGAVLLFGADAYLEGNDFQRVAAPGVGVFLNSAVHQQPVKMTM
jgi:nitrous oxidase accessory protein NosD